MQKKVIKIAIVAYQLEIGGLARTTRDLYHFFDQCEKTNVELLLLNEENRTNEMQQTINFKKRTNKNLDFLEKIKRYYSFKLYLDKSKFDFIIDQRYRLNPLLEVIILKIIYRKSNIIITVHSSNIETYLFKNVWFTRFLCKNVFKVVCCSDVLKNIIQTKFKLTNTHCIHNSIDLNNTKCNISEHIEDLKYILAVGRVEPLKQFDKLIISYSKTSLPNKNIKLLIIGGGSHLSKCKRLVNDLNLGDSVVFEGFVSKPQNYYKKALFTVLCSKYEGFGLVLLESLVEGTPVVSFDLPTGPSEIISDNVNGILVEDQNFEALGQAIELLAVDMKKLQFLGKNAIKMAEKFSQENIGKEWLKLLKVQ